MYPNALRQQESLTLVFVALGLGIIGMAFGRIRSRESLMLHRWNMTRAIALNVVSIFGSLGVHYNITPHSKCNVSRHCADVEEVACLIWRESHRR